MATYAICFCLLRIILPICLISSIIIRPLGFSFLYLLLMFYLPFTPVPTQKTFKGHAGHYLRAVLCISVLTMMCHIVWQITLVSIPESMYYSWLGTNTSTENSPLISTILRHIGLVTFYDLPFLNVLMWISPEILMFISSIVIYILIKQLCKGLPDDELQASAPKRKGSFIVSLGKYLSLLMLMLVGVLRPSVLSGVYYITFLGGATWWACGRELSRAYAIVCKFIMAILFCHTVILYAYQNEWFLDLLKADTNIDSDIVNDIARYIGMTRLIKMDPSDPRYIEYLPLEWASFVSPIVLLLTFYLLTIVSSELLKPQPEKKTGTFSKLESGSLNGSIRRQMSMRLSRKRMARNTLTQDKWRSATRKVRVRSSLEEAQASESTPLIRAVSPTRNFLSRRSNASGSIYYQDSTGSVTVAREEGIPMTRFNEPQEESDKPSIFEHIILVVAGIFQIMIRTSYIATAIIMIAWSITYHSWLTFVLLLWANIVWMVHDQRGFTLRSSPVLVAYAQFLLLAQYVYGMDLTEEELPSKSEKLNMAQFGFERPASLPCLPLMVKSLYTVMFWVTLRQLTQEKRERKHSNAIADMVGPMQVSIGAANPVLDEDPETSPLLKKFGQFLKGFFTKYWICGVAVLLFIIGISGERMTVFRIVYMALFLIFVLTFQISRRLWRKILYGFWVTVIIYSMLILILVYTYQFDNFPKYWNDYLRVPLELQLDIGLEGYETKELFLRLLTPTVFLIFTVVQLHYYHNDFLAVSHIKSRSSSVARQDSQGPQSIASSMMGGSSLPPATPSDKKTRESLEVEGGEIGKQDTLHIPTTSVHSAPSASMNFTTWIIQVQKMVFGFFSQIMELIFLFLELHLIKIIMVSIMLLCIFDVCAIHFAFVVIVCISLLFNTRIQIIVIQFLSTVTCLLLLTKMIYQIGSIKHHYWDVTCSFPSSSSENATVQNNAEWLGFKKTSDEVSFSKLVQGYIGLIIVITIRSLVEFRQCFKRYINQDPTTRPHLMFPKVTRLDADKDVKHFFQYLFNYGFYKFGVEICLMCLVALIGSRMDGWAVLYGGWLCILWCSKRERLARIWHWFVGFIVIVLPIQYLLIVGMLPELCISYPWMENDEILQRTSKWLMLPDPKNPPYAGKILCDFLLLLFCSRQSLVFRIERRHGENYKGGSNTDKIPDNWESNDFVNPVPDFVTYIRSWLDVIKRISMLGLLWVTLAIMFLTGTNRVNLFSMGYLIGSFVFLWQGTDLYLRPIHRTLKWWNCLLGYNVAVIVIKAFLQILGCIFIVTMQENACWLVQLLGIGCIEKFKDGFNIKTFLKMKRTLVEDQECNVPREDIGLAWDGVCFGFLLMQRRLFQSHYFLRIIDESKAITILQSRGAELIEELRMKQMNLQDQQEKKILEKIKVKMDRIKANQQKIQGPAYKDPSNHFVEEMSELKSSIVLKRSGSNVSECCVSIQTPNEGYHTPRTPTTPGSPRGYHTPISEEGSPSHLRSPPGPPSPYSALMTVSLDAYLEPQRISFGSPPSSELNPRAPSPSESFPVFSPPPPRRRRRSGPAPGWAPPALSPWAPPAAAMWAPPPPQQLHTPRHSVVSFSSRSQLSHHTSIRSGDYYMFDEFDDDEELDLIPEKDSEDAEDEADKNLTLGRLLSSAMKTDIGHATAVRRSSVPPPSQRSRLSTRSFRSARSRIRSMPSDVPLDPPGDPDNIHIIFDRDDDDGLEHSERQSSLKSEFDTLEKETLWNKICKYVLFAWAFFESLLISITRWLNKFSRDYRYIAKVLTREKIILKERQDFGSGVRSGSTQMWEPLPATLLRLREPRSSEASDDKYDQQLEPTQRPTTTSKQRRKESVLSVPEIRILAPSMERGLDLDSPLASPKYKPVRQSSVYSIPTSSESTTPIEEYDDETFASDQPTIFRVCFAAWYAILAHTDIVCYFMIFLNQIQSATILSLPLPLMVFLWGTLSIPRPSKSFWVTIIAYTEVIVLIKCMFQYEILPWNQSVIPNNLPFSAPRIIGVERKQNYALYDLILLLLVFFHRFMLISLGLWKSTVEPSDIPEDGVYPVSPSELTLVKEGHGLSIAQMFVKKKSDKFKSQDRKSQEEQLIESELKGDTIESTHDPPDKDTASPSLSKRSDIKKTEDDQTSLRKFTQDEPSNSEKKSTFEHDDDLSLAITALENPDDLEKGDEYMDIVKISSVLDNKYKHFPGVIKLSVLRYGESIKDFYCRMVDPTSRVKADVYAYMFMCDFFNFMVVIFGFSAFGTQQGDGGVQAYLEENKVPIPFLVMLILQFGLIVIDRALFLRKFILGKLLFQICLIFGVHIWMFFVLPAVTERSFNALLPPPMWYMVKCIYLLLSAYQIRCGYPSRILGNFLCKGYNYVNTFLFKGFMIIPFLFELRALMDWIWTDTAMTLMDWLKMEDIFANVFQLKCSRYVESEYPQPRGEKKNPMTKYLMGGSVLAFIIALIWFPLVLFAFGNTVGESNPPYDITIKIRIGPYLPVYTMSAQSNNIGTFSESQWDTIINVYKKDRTAQTFLSNYIFDDVAAVSFNGNSTNIWGISPPDKERIKFDAMSNDTMNIKLTYVLSHKTNSKDNPPVIEEEIDVSLSAFVNGVRNPKRDILVEMLSEKADAGPITIENIFPKFIKVFNKGTAKPVHQLMREEKRLDDTMYRNITLKLASSGGLLWWEVKEQCSDLNYEDFLHHIPFMDCTKLVMYTFNDKLFPTTLNFISGSGIIGLYTTFVFLASRALRGFFSGICFKIMFEDLPNVDRVLQLCLDIYLVRESGELSLEEDLFAKLVFLYRSPETMIKWSRSKDEPEPEEEEMQRRQD